MASDALHDLFDRTFERDLEERPELATYLGRPGNHDRWSDLGTDAIERRRQVPGQVLKELAAIDRRQLDETDGLSYDLFEWIQRDHQEAAAFPSHLLAIDQMGGPQQDPAQVLAMMPTGTAGERANIVARIEGVPRLIDQSIDLLREGLSLGVTAPRVVLRDVADQVRAQLDGGPLLAPLEGQPEHLAAQKVVRETVTPAYERLLAFVTDEYLPGARESIACVDRPDGEAWYAHAIRSHTTTDLTASEIHQIGLDEVARIDAATRDVIDEIGFDGTFAEFCAFMRTDPQFFCTTADELLGRYRDISKRVDPELCRLFGRLPRLPYGVCAVPAYAEQSQTTAYYLPGSPEAHRPAWYFANTYDLTSRPIWEMEALTLHEAVPGHHLQIALAQEIEDLPWFRRSWSAFTAYTEGWGLYAESLGPELGFYQDPYSRFGQLTYEMWRAVRLVVDTGMHALGWSRDKAIAFFAEHAAKATHDIVVEVDRYIAWPGQALAYKLGELKLKELRAVARTAQKDRFDVRAFHDEVLAHGPMPLDILDARIRAWSGAPVA
ncbi:MAG: hypothetical protein QOG03_1644 [Actinomycetota bacterium]|jgi:uncharacterized protein (DUF885 family)|nr:hypothetical protein [Actinomycetota bacterium]